MLQMTDAIFRYGVVEGFNLQNPASAFRRDIFGKIRRKNFSRISQGELPALLVKMEFYDGMALTRLALKLVVRAFLRTSEMIEARWPEINWTKRVEPCG
jgi:integrase